MAMDTDIAWAAGFLDGEGHFGVNGARGRCQPFMAATQARNREPLDKLAELFDGSVHCYDYAYKNSYCTWRLSGARRLAIALPLLIPYLVVKNEQAIALLLLAECIIEDGIVGRPGLSQVQLDEREAISVYLKELRQ